MSRTWIFQCNPDRFDIDGYLTQNVGQLSWLVARYKDDIGVGDTVYLWRSGEDAGIVSEAEVIGPVETRLDDPEAQPFWIGGDAGLEPSPRVRMALKRVANRREVIQRSWLKEDHQLRDLSIIKMPTGTNFPVAPHLVTRLAAIWANTGRNWTYPEVVAALWAYEQVWDQSISTGKGSPVDQVSRLINRVLPGVYNKLMNFRALDPRVAAKGLDAGSKVDRQAWEEFFDGGAQSIRTAALRQRFEELWPPSESGPEQPTLPDESAVRDALDAEVIRLEKVLREKTLAELMVLYAGQAKKTHARRRPTRTNAFDRNPLVVLITKRRASFKCEVVGCQVPAFIAGDNKPYVETHHLVPLADGGDDRIENTACLCAVHHREIHCGKNRDMLTAALQTIRAT
ncbi:MAG: EVE domain-containing protein [Reyranella sp.]